MFIWFYRTVDQRPKLYALRTTWDDVFEPRILYDLDIKVNISIFIMTTHDYDPKILLFITYVTVWIMYIF